MNRDPAKTSGNVAPDLAVNNPGFIDGLWKHLDASFRQEAERRLAASIRRQATPKWIIAADFCVRDQARPNDAFAFVILPAGDRLRQTNALLQGLPNKDLKETRQIVIKRALRGGHAFTFCFAADRDRRLFENAEQARLSLDHVAMMEAWKNADQCSERCCHANDSAHPFDE
jgi:hypothetical protein